MKLEVEITYMRMKEEFKGHLLCQSLCIFVE